MTLKTLQFGAHRTVTPETTDETVSVPSLLSSKIRRNDSTLCSLDGLVESAPAHGVRGLEIGDP